MPSSADNSSKNETSPRQSLPVISNSQISHSKLRPTQSYHLDRKHKRKPKNSGPLAEPIPENQLEEKLAQREYSHEQIRLSIISEGEERRSSRSSKKSDKHSPRGYDNAAFDVGRELGGSSANASRTNSTGTSLRSSRNPSVQSLTVIREQYCCCAKRTPCERILVASVAVLATIIVILVIVISFMASNKNKGVDETFRWSL